MVGYNISVPPFVRQALFSRAFDNDDLLPKLGKPVLVTHGEADAIVRLSVLGQYSDRVPHAEIHIMPDAGHAPFWDDSTSFNRRLAEFCQTVARRPLVGSR
jgi:non-heme chloroperoxidase